MKYLSCVCGCSSANHWAKVSGIPILECADCGIRYVQYVDEDANSKMYASGEYHNSGSPDIHPQDVDRAPIVSRFDVDYAVAVKRLTTLHQKYKLTGHVIDVGCGNGAFMAAADNNGYTVEGVDLANSVQGELRDSVRVADLQYAGFQRRVADVIAFNDVLEHFIDPISALKTARGILKRDGVLVVEIPDMGSAEALEQGVNFKHVKPHEHLWYFTAAQLRTLLEVNGFTVVGIEVPIPGKVTVYASPSATVEDIEIWGPPGIGDILWTLHKLKGIREKEYPCRIKYVVCADGDRKIVTRSRDFLCLCKYIDSVEFRPIPLPRDVGCSDASQPVYELFANDYLDPKTERPVGGMLDDWRPELPNKDWDIGIEIPHCALAQAKMRLRSGRKYVAVYMSSHVWNRIVTEPVWTPRHWAETFILLSDSGYTPLLIGAGWDAEYANDVIYEMMQLGREPYDIVTNVIGRTSVPLVMAYMKSSVACLGIANGLPMLAPYFDVPTAVLWPVRGESPTETVFCTEFAYNWLPKHLRVPELYKHLTVGKFTPRDILQTVKGFDRTNEIQTRHVG